jgi:hypothetical protein
MPALVAGIHAVAQSIILAVTTPPCMQEFVAVLQRILAFDGVDARDNPRIKSGDGYDGEGDAHRMSS